MSSAARARWSPLLTAASVVSSIPATSAARNPSTSRSTSDRALRRRQVLQAGDEGEPDRLARLVALVRALGAVGDASSRTSGTAAATAARRCASARAGRAAGRGAWRPGPPRRVAQRVQAAVRRDPVEPGADRGAALEAAQARARRPRTSPARGPPRPGRSRACGSSAPRSRGARARSGAERGLVARASPALTTATAHVRTGHRRAPKLIGPFRERAGVYIDMTADRQTTPRWVLALASVASLMVALDTLVVSTALSTIRLELDASLAALEWTVNAYNLSFAVLLMTGAALGDRFGRRRGVRARARRLRRRLGGVRAGADGRRADRGARRPGRGRGARDAARAGAGELRVRAGAARPGARDLLRRDRARGRERARRRRRDHRRARVGVDLLAQRPARPRADPVRAAPDPGVAAGRTAALDLARPGARGRARRSAWSGGSCAATSRAGPALEVVGSRSPRACCWPRRSCAWELRARDPMLPLRLLPLARVLGGQRGGVLLRRLAVRRGVLPRPVPADRARLRAARRRPAAAAVDADAVLRRAARGRAGRPATASGRSWSAGCCCRGSGWAGSR